MGDARILDRSPAGRTKISLLLRQGVFRSLAAQIVVDLIEGRSDLGEPGLGLLEELLPGLLASFSRATPKRASS
jgi:hypothetical protein